MEKIRILIVSDRSRLVEADIDNAYNAFEKYLSDDRKAIIETITQLDYMACQVWEQHSEKTGKELEMIIHKLDYLENDLVDNCDVLILFPSLDRSGFCEDIEKKWMKKKGYVNVESL
jgi:hypothetical protein